MDTPKTDAFLKREHVAWDGMWISFARELERENNSLRQERDIALVTDPNELNAKAHGMRADQGDKKQ